MKDAMRMESARWDGDGQPENLAAAVADAAEWLELLTRATDWLNVENRERCQRALDALRLQATPLEQRRDSP